MVHLVGLNLSEPLALPGFLTACAIPILYATNVVTRNVSSVDRIYTTWPVLCSLLIATHARGEAIASLPRLLLAIGIQLVWYVRLTHHSARRGFYDLRMEDYRYPIVRRLVPKWFFEIIVHIFAVVIAQPLLLLTLTFPIAAMIMPAPALSYGPLPSLYISLRAFWPLRSAARAADVPLSTPVLHVGDLLFALMGLGAVLVEKLTDDAMYAFQEAKHAAMRAGAGVRTRRQSAKEDAPETGVPQPVDVPAEFYPGFPTTGLHAIVRHPNFAAEQLFWLSQALLGLFAGPVAPRIGGCLVPPLLLSFLFLGSTTLTEWITSHRYPAYKTYQQLVGQFLPQETAIKYIWTTLRGTREELQAELHRPE